MSVVCSSFRQNAWKKDLCSDCFRPENDHQLVDVRLNSTGPNIITTTEWNGKVQALQSTKVNLNELRTSKGSTNGYSNKINNYNSSNVNGNNVNINNSNTYNKKSNQQTPQIGSIKQATDVHGTNVTNGDTNISGKVAILNQRNLDKCDDIFEPVKGSTNGHSDNSHNTNSKGMMIKSNLAPPITKVVGILKIKSESSDQSRKGSVQFLCDPIVIGYCDDDDSGNEESEEELDYCDYNSDEVEDYSEEDSEFSRLTASNTRFNSIGANLRDSKILQTFGQMNNQSIGISFRIGDFKSETRKHDYDETLIGCNRVSELIGDEKRGKPTNGSSVNLPTSTTTSTTTALVEASDNGINHLHNSNQTSIDDEPIINGNGVVSNNSLHVNGHDKSNNRSVNGKHENASSANGKKSSGNQINNNNNDKSSTTSTTSSPTSSSPINSNVVNLSPVINGSSSPSPKPSAKPSTASNTSTNKLTNSNNNGSTSTNIHSRSTIATFVVNAADSELKNANDTLDSDTSSPSQSSINIVTNGETLKTTPVNPQDKNGNLNSETFKLTSQSTKSSTSPLTLISSIAIADTSTSITVASTPTPNVTLASMKPESSSSTVDASEKSNIKPILVVKSDTEGSVAIKITGKVANETSKIDEPSSPESETIVESCPIISRNSVEMRDDHSTGDCDDHQMMEPVAECADRLMEITSVNVIDHKLSTANDMRMENELSAISDDGNERVNKKGVKSMDDETESIDDPVNIDDSSSTIDINDASTPTNIFTSNSDDDDPEDGDDDDDNSDNKPDRYDNDYDDVAVITSSVSLTLTTNSTSRKLNEDDPESSEVESVNIFTTINDSHNNNNNKINSISVDVERNDIPKKPERTLKSSLKPRIPSKPLSLNHVNKVNDEECFNGNGIESHLMINGDKDENNKYHDSNGFHVSDSMVDQFSQSKSELNVTWDHITNNNYTNNVNNNNHQSSRELRLAELAQELESVRHQGKRQAPVPPTSSSSSTSSTSSTHEAYDRPSKFNTLTRCNLPVPPPRPPPPPIAGLKHIVNGYHGSNIFHSSKDHNHNGNVNSGGTKFSLKKLLKLSKDDNDLEHHNGESISGKIWKHKFDLDRRKSSPGHQQYHFNEPDRSTSGSYDVNKSSFYTNGRERSFSLSGNSCLPIQHQHQHLHQQQQQQQQLQKSSDGFRPIVPARRSRSNDVNSQNNLNKNGSSDSLILNRYIISTSSTTNGSSNNVKSIINPSPLSQLAITPTSSPTNSDTISSPSPPSTSSSSVSPLPRSSTSTANSSKLNSPTDLILTNLNLDSAYTVIAKYNIDTINRILHNYSTTHQSYKNISKKDLFYESFRLIGPETKIYKDAYLKSETISANFLVTPLAYSIRSEASHDLQYGQFIDSNENVKLFALKPEFDLIITLDRLLDDDFTDLNGNLNSKSAAFIVLQFIGLLKYYQANGMEEIHEEQLKLTMLCCNKKFSTSNIYLISPSFDHISNVNRDRLSSSSSSSALSLCKCVKLLVKNLRRKLVKSDDLITSVEEILDEERSSSLSLAKTICEIIIFEIPFNFESPATLELWLDIQRTKFINLLNYETVTESMSHKTVYNYYFMLFLTRSNVPTLFQCINQIRGKLLPHS